jgi:tetratricopeptide (TPR) repeat protein
METETLLRRHRVLIVAVVAVFLLAAGLRLGHVESLRQSFEGSHAFSTGRVDAAFHLREAREIVEGDFWLRNRVHWKGPGYSYFLAGLMGLLGRDAGSYRWVVAVLGALNCAVLVLLARRLLSSRGAVIAGTLSAIHGVVLLFDAELYFPTLLITLNLGIFLLLLRKDGGPLSAAVAGVLLGAAALVHPSYLLAGAAVFAWLLRAGIRRALPFALAAAITVAPVTLKNLLLHGQPVLISSSGGINFYLGNQPGLDQSSGQGTPAWNRVLHTPSDAGINGEAEQDRLYYGLAADRLIEAPLGALLIFGEKALLFLGPLEIANNFRLYELRDHSPILRALLGRAGPLHWPFGLWAPLAWVGAVLLWRRRVAGQGLLLLWALAIALSCVLFFNTARYRAPVVFFGSIWAAAAVDAGWFALRQPNRRSHSGGIVVLVLLAVLTALLAVPQLSLPPPLENSEAKVLEELGRHREAARMHEQVCEKHPGDAGLLLSAAAYHGRRGQQRQSRAYLDRVLDLERLRPDELSDTHEALAESFLVEGRLEESAAEFRRALEIRVDDANWMGEPFFSLGLGPVTACRLELGLAEVAARRGESVQARERADRVTATCGAYGRIAARLERLERLLDTPGGEGRR